MLNMRYAIIKETQRIKIKTQMKAIRQTTKQLNSRDMQLQSFLFYFMFFKLSLGIESTFEHTCNSPSNIAHKQLTI